MATIYHGIAIDLHQLGEGDGNYLAFLGRRAPEKDLPKTIEIAKAAGIKLKVAANIEKAD